MILNDEPYMLPRPDVTPQPAQPPNWRYDGSDPALMLFTAALERFRFTFPMGSRVLELGCAESDWLERMHRMDPSLELVGVDARKQKREEDGFALIEGSAMAKNLFPAESFDRIVLLGALEHFGLGFYGDPEATSGDTLTMQNVAHWLRPGGFVYFDVPVQPTYRVAENRHFRMYAPGDIQRRLLVQTWQPVTHPSQRFWKIRRDDGTYEERPEGPQLGQRIGLEEVNRAYSLPEPWAGTWCAEPTVERVPYWFVAVLAQKVVV